MQEDSDSVKWDTLETTANTTIGKSKHVLETFPHF